MDIEEYYERHFHDVQDILEEQRKARSGDDGEDEESIVQRLRIHRASREHNKA